MCFASPKAQVDPSNPANYSTADSYGQVTSSKVDANGNVTGGKTVAQQYQDNLKDGVPNANPSTVVAAPPEAAPKPVSRSDYSGVTKLRM